MASSKYEYTLDVVSNGSEATEPTVFLSVLRRSAGSSSDLEACDLHENPVVARYALLGVGDMTTRLVADQKFSLAPLRAVFCHNNHRHSHSSSPSQCPHMGVNGGGLWALPAIFLELNRAGASKLTVVTGNKDDASIVEEWREVLPTRTHPSLLLTAVPFVNSVDHPVSWFKMYEDEYLLMHATCTGKLENVIYLCTCKQHPSEANYTLVVLPCPHARSFFIDTWKLRENRVLLGDDHVQINAFLAAGNGSDDRGFCSDVQDSFPGVRVFFCRPRDRDAGILVRATEVVKAWHEFLPQNIVWREPPPRVKQLSESTEELLDLFSFSSVQLNATKSPLIIDRSEPILERCRQHATAAEDDVQSLRTFLGNGVDQTKPTVGENGAPCAAQDQSDENEIDIDDTCSEQEEASPLLLLGCENQSDENEIDIDDCDGEEGDGLPLQMAPTELLKPHDGSKRNQTTTTAELAAKIEDSPCFLVLGTGCATPSPVRGSSGYGLLLPQLFETTDKSSANNETAPREALLLTSIVECGEGVLSMLQRHLPRVDNSTTDSECLYDHLRFVKFIWISHHHLDHYGGLPAVLSAICEARIQSIRRQQAAERHGNKRPKRGDPQPPVLIVAPRQVLKYLGIVLRSNADIRNLKSMTGSQLYQGFTHEQNPLWWPCLASLSVVRLRRFGAKQPRNSSTHYTSFGHRPFAFWANVRVEHCFDAYGFIMGLRVPNQNFVGDYCGVAFTHGGMQQPECKVVTFAYSGDTRPCKRFMDLCVRDCRAFSNGALHYLLHEASFDDTEQRQSLEKRHSSLSEALNVASSVHAQRVILTHFSQRYTAHPPMELPGNPRKYRVAFAMDGLLIPLTHIPIPVDG